MSNRKNLANAILALGVSTSDTTWVLESGYGDEMPDVPFDLTATPFGQLSTMGNSEIVRVTAVSTDTLTVERAQKGTTAKAFGAGSVVSNGISTDDVVGIEVASATARTTAAKVGTTADGNYTPVYGDKINVTFTLGIAVATPTLNIDGSGAKNIRLGTSNVSTSILNTTASSVTIPMWYDGTYWQLFGSYVADTNTTYVAMTTAEVDAGTGTTTRSITGVVAKYIIDKAIAAVQALTNWITTAMLQDASVTSDKIEWATIVNVFFPVGATFVSESDTMPTEITDVSTWVRLPGVMIVGVDESQVEFDTVNKTGGHKKMQAHIHGINPPSTTTSAIGNHTHDNYSNLTRYSGGTSEVGLAGGGTKYLSAATHSAAGGHSHTVNIGAFNSGSSGDGDSENLSPYKTKYMWERTA